MDFQSCFGFNWPEKGLSSIKDKILILIWMIKSQKPLKRGKKTSSKSFKKIKIDVGQIEMGHELLEKRQHSKLTKSKEPELSYTVDGVAGDENGEQKSLKRRQPLDPDRFKKKITPLTKELSDALRKSSKRIEKSKGNDPIEAEAVEGDIWSKKALQVPPKKPKADENEAELRKDPFALVRKSNSDKTPIGAESYNPSMADYNEGLEMLVKKKQPLDNSKKLEEKRKRKLAKLRNESNLASKPMKMPKNPKAREQLEEKAKRKAEKKAKYDSQNIDLYVRELDRKMTKEERKREEKRKLRESINQQIAKGLIPPVKKRGGIEMTTQDPFIPEESELQGNLRKMIKMNKSAVRDVFNGFSRKGIYEPSDPFSGNKKRQKDNRKEHGREAQEKRIIEDYNLVL